ncbi:ABC transporter ATP-binding protein [Aureimonas phyllosphaerae]|uniref:Putative spermidine/putrescine transport system ATP-binding protein n=1 Tax=Aureimonas phyllosphaerae TaxID=1166078 RepID=A0A7W6BV92_9HYPH|nr:ABC transporter ATP-binding protein [Aureimonas phyllosphaerae]MBB3936935.1 putative spermidine/putrescine transport system ATP-binding protein [Aureimonas phyllosphaerae]MBB3960950.1 putative spermidine/putrescine transport system ATP-binding protein [Aureimonas phyllosphaerae]SFF27606.1 putative spermidine/putrescine transport system ATP-binding protein [Aureimonas phyllosphaerae]
MTALVLSGVTKRYGAATAVDAVDLAIPEGTFVCLLGPSGCGKTTLMRMIAGLETPTAGDIRFGSETITHVPVHKRGFGMVFQSLALFPHLTVGDNIAYPLRLRGTSRGAAEARVRELLDLVRLPGVEGRAITQLSGGQRQRVAIARALAVAPRLFLLDEPLSALDAKLREAMQVELRLLQERLGITTIVVTHDQREAMTMADQVVVMQNGRVLQMDRPIEVYRRPATPFVADFLGQTNLLEARREAGGARLASGALLPGLALPGEAALLSVRPEDVVLLPEGDGPIAARVEFVRDMGSAVEIYLRSGDARIIAHREAGADVPPAGTPVSLALKPGAATVFPAGAA